MRKKRRTEITVETDQVLILREGRRGTNTAVRPWCAECSKEVRMMTAEEAAVTVGVSSRTIYRWVEAGRIHFMETAEGSLFICLNSLP